MLDNSECLPRHGGTIIRICSYRVTAGRTTEQVLLLHGRIRKSNILSRNKTSSKKIERENVFRNFTKKRPIICVDTSVSNLARFGWV